MLYYLAELSQNLSVLNVFRYITFRAGGAFFTALVYGFLFGRPLIEMLRVRQGRGQSRTGRLGKLQEQGAGPAPLHQSALQL